MQRSFLVFAIAFMALMAGALFYAARIPVQAPEAVTDIDPQPFEKVDGPIFPSFRLADLEGTQRDFSEWAGKHRLLNFWATWCAPCRREIPLLKAFQEEHGANGFQVIGIAVEIRDPVIAYAEAAEFNYPILIGELDAMAVAETSGVEFVGMPFTMIVAADGEFLSAHIGELHAQHLDDIVKVLARLDNGEIDKESARKALDFL